MIFDIIKVSMHLNLIIGRQGKKILLVGIRIQINLTIISNNNIY